MATRKTITQTIAMRMQESGTTWKEAVKAHKRSLREQEWHEASLVKYSTPVAVDAPYEIDKSIFTD